MKTTSLHGTCVEVKGKGVLITGNPGAGKSALALQLMDRGALFISDDQTVLSQETGEIVIQAPLALKGLMEVRGVGICQFPCQEKSFLRLFVEICDSIDVERLPEPSFVEYYGIRVPYLKILKGDPLGAIKIELKVDIKDEPYTQ